MYMLTLCHSITLYLIFDKRTKKIWLMCKDPPNALTMTKGLSTQIDLQKTGHLVKNGNKKTGVMSQVTSMITNKRVTTFKLVSVEIHS